MRTLGLKPKASLVVGLCVLASPTVLDPSQYWGCPLLYCHSLCEILALSNFERYLHRSTIASYVRAVVL